MLCSTHLCVSVQSDSNPSIMLIFIACDLFYLWHEIKLNFQFLCSSLWGGCRAHSECSCAGLRGHQGSAWCSSTARECAVTALPCAGHVPVCHQTWAQCPLSPAGIQTIDSTQALFLPIGASVSLLVMFFFFDSVQVVFTICTAGDLSFLLFIRLRIEQKELI